MNRKNFFKTLVGGVIGLVALPKAIDFIEQKELEVSYKEASIIADADLYARLNYTFVTGEELMIVNNGFYCIGDIFRCNDMIFRVTRIERNYLHAILI